MSGTESEDKDTILNCHCPDGRRHGNHYGEIFRNAVTEVESSLLSELIPSKTLPLLNLSLSLLQTATDCLNGGNRCRKINHPLMQSAMLVGGEGALSLVNRHGAKKAEIEGLFQFENIKEHPSYEKARQFGIDVEDEMLILRREIFHTGKSVCRINGKLVTITLF